MYRAIIPCAGFGTRVNMKPHESKEMLLDDQGKKIIDWSIDLCKKENLEPLIISREQKEELNSYIKSIGIEIFFDEGKSIGSSIMASQDRWWDSNILILPDTRFTYDGSFLKNFFYPLELGNNACFGIFEVKDKNYKDWGVVSNNTLYEKPMCDFKDLAMAWGTISFKKEYGSTIFDGYKPGFKRKIDNCGFSIINNFTDISRGKK